MTFNGYYSPPPDAATWPSYHFGPGNAGHNPAANGPERPLSRWERELANDVGGPILGPESVYVPQDDATVTAVDPGIDDVRWATTVDDVTAARNDTVLALADGRLFASVAGTLHALDPADGDVTATRTAFHGLHDRPAISGDTVAVPSDEGFVYGFETVA